MQETKTTQFYIILYLPRKALMTFADFCQQLEGALTVYQQNVDTDMHWYLLKNTMKVKPEELVYNPAGFTDFGLKKLSLAWQKIDKKGDTQIFFVDGEQKSAGQVTTYSAMKDYNDSMISSNIRSLFTKIPSSQMLNQITAFVTGLANVFSDSYITFEMYGGFDRSDYLFPQRVGCSLITYIPSSLQASDYPEAYQVIPINKEDKQVGTVMVSLDHFPLRTNTEDVKTINRIDLRLREADLLPMGVNL